MAMWLACPQQTGLSAAVLQRPLGLGSYRTAWLMLQKLRQARVRMDRDLLTGASEVDETYIGGAEEGVRGRELSDKSLVVIAVELVGRNVGRVRLRHVPEATGGSLVGLLSDFGKTGVLVHK